MHLFFNKYKIFTYFRTYSSIRQNIYTFSKTKNIKIWTVKICPFPKHFQFGDPNVQVHPHNETQQSNKACSVAFTEIDFWKHGEDFCKNRGTVVNFLFVMVRSNQCKFWNFFFSRKISSHNESVFFPQKLVKGVSKNKTPDPNSKYRRCEFGAIKTMYQDTYSLSVMTIRRVFTRTFVNTSLAAVCFAY